MPQLTNNDKHDEDGTDMITPLEGLEPRQFIESIREKNHKFYSDPRGKGSLKDLQQTFPHPWLYVAELLQNAIDEKASRIHLSINEDGQLVFEHNGNPFDYKDVDALCVRGVSTKGASTVGFMGIGFKSVFRSFENAHISSGPWKFSLKVAVNKGSEFGDLQRDWLGAVLPQWDESVVSPSTGMTCRFVLSGRLPGLNPVEDDLDRLVGKDETLLALLAWRGVEELTWNGKRWLLGKSAKPLGDGEDYRLMLEALDDSGSGLRRWVMFLANYEPSDEAIGRFLEHRQLDPSGDEKERVYAEASRRREVAVFCEVDDGNDPVPTDRGSAFALLPTGVTLPIGLHVQADWLLVVSRQEIMQIEGNKWHVEILLQIPKLLCHFLEWVVSDETGEDWERGYDALPANYRSDAETDRWFNRKEFRDRLREEIENLPFLPVLVEDDSTVDFITPQHARALPDALAIIFADDASRQTLLFGNQVVSRNLLGKRALQCVSSLELIAELSADELTEQWSQGRVGIWLKQFDESDREKRLASLLAALTKLDVNELWKAAELKCLPTESGEWTSRQFAQRFPRDWNVLAQEADIRSALAPFMRSPDAMLSWKLDSAWTLARSPALSYIESVSTPRLEELVTLWWESLPEQPTAEQSQLVVQFTSWVRTKQPQRKSMVRKLLCTHNDGSLKLLLAESTLLAEPYAGDFRRTFFPAHPVVVSDYIDVDMSASLADWRSFFESLNPHPQGQFALRLSVKTLSSYQLRELFGTDYQPPDLRATWFRTKWRGLEIDNSAYKLLEPELPRALKDLLDKDDISLEMAADVAAWLADTPGMLKEYTALRLAYIAYFQNVVTETRLDYPAAWIQDLKDISWVPAQQRTRPYRPEDVLAFSDPARPQFPVANLPDELISILQQAGIPFGSALPDAPAIDRLSIQGPDADPKTLLDLVRKAIEDAQDDEKKRNYLLKILKERNLFLIPAGGTSIDERTRVPYSRLVRSALRSTLADWIVAVERFNRESIERKVLELIDSFAPVPETTSADQVLGFLSWVWSTRPEAERVRNVLPRAYQYLRNDLPGDSVLLRNWADLRQAAEVFVTPQRRWVAVQGNDRVYLDDLGQAIPGSITSKLELATPGHLGEDMADRAATAELLGLRLLSSRFRVEVRPEGREPLPAHWGQGFEYIQNRLREQLGYGSSADEEDKWSEQDDRPTFTLSLWRDIRTLVFDRDDEVHASRSRAALINDMIAVSGTPAEFAAELCTVLCNRWGLRLRRDLADLLPKVVIQLMQLNDPTLVSVWLSGGSRPAKEEPREIDHQNPELAPAGDAQPTGQNVPWPSPALLNNPLVGDVQPPPQGPLPKGGSHTATDRETRLDNLLRQRKELDRQISELATVGIVPDSDEEELAPGAEGKFRSDDPYRDAVIEYERDRGRWAVPKSPTQEGHDIDSYTHEEGHPERRLLRRIEVKGKGVNWTSGEIVEMSDSQFRHALTQKVEDEILLHPEFDYWLYVVEHDGSGLHVLPIKNPVRRAARYELRGATWREFAEHEDPQFGLIK